MSCTTESCGTGEGNIPKPGDPSNNGLLTAKPAFGGIDINWTYPTTNPFAVAYTTIYRAISNNFNAAILLVPQVGNGFYYDPVDPGVEYFYWITFVSINGTVGDLIGPVSAVAKSSIDKTIQELTGKIDQGVLAQSLKTDIAKISENAAAIIQEAQIRLNGQLGLSDQILGQQEVTDETVAAVFSESTAREDADSAIVDTVNLLFAEVGESSAAILEESIVRAGADEVLAQKITTAETTLGENIAQVQVGLETQITAIEGDVTNIGALYTAKVNVNGLVGGFVIYNDGSEVEAGFDVDTFWIGRTAGDKKKPFIVTGGQVFIDEAVINELVFTKLRDESGSVIVENGRLKAQYIDADNIVAKQIDLTSGVPGQPTTRQVNGLTEIFYPDGSLCLRLGVW